MNFFDLFFYQYKKLFRVEALSEELRKKGWQKYKEMKSAKAGLGVSPSRLPVDPSIEPIIIL